MPPPIETRRDREIRVAVVIETLGRGGAEHLMVDTLRLLDRSRYRTIVYTLFSKPDDHESGLRAMGISVSCLHLADRWDLLAGFRRLRATFSDDPPDIVHTHLYAANLIGRLAARSVGVPVVSTSHAADWDPAERRGNPGLTRRKQLLLQFGDAATAAVSRATVIAVSEYVARSVRRRLGMRGSRVEVIHNGVDTGLFRPDPARRDAVRESLGLRPATKVLICVGKLASQKGQETLIRAMAGLTAGASPACLLLVGDGIQRGRYESLVSDLRLRSAVSFLGERSDVPDLMRASDVLVLPSYHEGFGLVLVEALASGVPVIASRTGPVPEIVRQGETGLLVNPGDVGGLAQAIAGLLADPDRLRRMGQLGREDALGRFDLSRTVARLDALYAEIHRRKTLRRGKGATGSATPAS